MSRGISKNQQALIATLKAAGNKGHTNKELLQAYNIAPQSLSRALKSLEARELVYQDSKLKRWFVSGVEAYPEAHNYLLASEEKAKEKKAVREEKEEKAVLKTIDLIRVHCMYEDWEDAIKLIEKLKIKNQSPTLQKLVPESLLSLPADTITLLLNLTTKPEKRLHILQRVLGYQFSQEDIDHYISTLGYGLSYDKFQLNAIRSYKAGGMSETFLNERMAAVRKKVVLEKEKNKREAQQAIAEEYQWLLDNFGESESFKRSYLSPTVKDRTFNSYTDWRRSVERYAPKDILEAFLKTCPCNPVLY